MSRHQADVSAEYFLESPAEPLTATRGIANAGTAPQDRGKWYTSRQLRHWDVLHTLERPGRVGIFWIKSEEEPIPQESSPRLPLHSSSSKTRL